METNALALTSPRTAGTLTFMLTDLENSTRLWEIYPSKMRAILARHDELIEKAVGDNAGLVIKPRGEGDSRFVVFSRANDAVLAAAEVQRALDQEPWNMPENIRVRIAVHTGSAELHDGDYYGPTVNRCARLRSITHGGQILVTQVTYNLVHESVPPEFAFLDLGEHKLKDISQAERIYQLLVPGLPAEFPPLPTPIRLVQNLPIILTSFIGRESAVAQVTNLLITRRLITISGSGGVGKTRLAVQSALLAMEHFPGGGWFIDFTSITNPTLVTQHLMTTLGIYEDSCCSPAERLEYYFHDKKMLIIIDNCEHVLPGITQLVHFLLAATDRLTILATSREPLGVVGETIWYIAPLSTPKLGEEISLETLLTYESVALFAERAAAISDFELTHRNAQAVAQVCARLDGIPLALELAAARMNVLSTADLAERLNDRFSLLASNQNVPRRQRTIRNLIDWSYDLLPEKERVLLRRLSIFAGGWTLQAIEQVCAGDSLDLAEVLDLLIHLVDRSLVISETVDDGKRYRLLETIRQYGQERLNESQESEVLARRHAAYFTRLAEELASELWGSRQGVCLRQLDLEHDNLRAALEWLASTEDMAEMMLRLGGALWRFWRIRGHYQEGRMRLDQALTRSSSEARGLRAEGLRGAAILALQQGEYVPATKLIEQSLSLQREIGNKQGIGHALDLLGEIAHYQGDYDQAIAYHEQSLALRSEIGDQHGLANSLRQLGVIAREWGDFQQAEARLTQSLALGRRLDDRILLAKTLDNLGLVEHHRCNYDRAHQFFAEAVLICRELNDRLGISNTLQNLGNAAKDQGEFREAKATYDESLQLKQALGDRRGIAQTLANLAELAFYQGKYNKAAELAGRSLSLFQDLGVKRGIIFTLGLLAYTAQYNGRFEQAAALANECLQLATKLNAPRPIAYCKEVIGLIAYAQDDLDRARHYFLEAIDLFEKVGDRRNVASARINLARTIYRQGDHATALKHVNDSLDISYKLNLRWTLSLGLEISGLLHRSQHNNSAALISFQESLKISLDQDNRQGIANCLGAIGGLAVIANQAAVALTLFAAAQRIREEIGAGMGSGDRAEYEYYLTLARQQIAEHEFRPIWQRGSELTLDQVVELAQLQPPSPVLRIINCMEVVNEN